MKLLQVIDNKNNMEKESFFSMKTIIALVVGIVIGFFGAWIPMRNQAGSSDNIKTETEMTDEVSDTSDIKLLGKNSIVVRDQEAGVIVNVELVTLENPGWVVIHDDNNGVLGNALGAQLFLNGVNSGTVELLRGMEEDKTYYAAIRQDDGDKAFDLTKDLLLFDKKGNPIQVKFKAVEELIE